MIGPALVMAALALAGWAGAVVVWGAAVRTAVGLGVAGPLVGAIASWVVIVRTVRADPQRLTGRMVGALAAKMAFFAAFVVWAVRGAHVELTAFAISFAAGFIVLHGMEAVLLQRMLAQGTSGPAAREATKI